MAPTKELKPPPELVEAIQQSEDSTAPADFVVGTEFGNMPRTIRNRLVHEEPQKLLRDEEGGGGGEGPTAISKAEYKDHMKEVHLMQFEKERHNRYGRNHPGAGKAGQGDQNVSSQVATRGEGGGRMRFGHE